MLNKTRLKSTRNKKLPSIAGTDGSDGLMEGEIEVQVVGGGERMMHQFVVHFLLNFQN